MAAIEKSSVSLRVFGDDLDPDEVSRLLGAAPTSAARQGERLNPMKSYVARTGTWLRAATDRSPEDLDGQVAEIFGGLATDPAIWRNLVSRFDVDLFCGLFMSETNEGFSLAPVTLTLLAERGVSIDFDVYAVGEPENSERLA